MAWQAYVDTNLIASGSVTSAGIYDLTGNPWAYSAGFAAQIAEVASVAAHMGADATALAATGVRHCGDANPRGAQRRSVLKARPRARGAHRRSSSRASSTCS